MRRSLLPKSLSSPGPSITVTAHYSIALTIDTLFASTHALLLAPFYRQRN